MSAKEPEAVRTTIVGGRPPGSGRTNLSVPRGIEVLVKKAAVDPGFRERLLEIRGAAAEEIELRLTAAEAAMLGRVPREQLLQVIEQTAVPDEQRRAFLGKVAVAMLAALGPGLSGCSEAEPAGIQPDRPTNSPATRGIQPDQPTPLPPPPSQGIRPDRPGTPGGATNAAGTNPPLPIAGVKPDRL